MANLGQPGPANTENNNDDGVDGDDNEKMVMVMTTDGDDNEMMTLDGWQWTVMTMT